MEAFAAGTDSVPLTDKDFVFLTGFLYERAGIRMGDAKRALVSGRLTKRVLALGFTSFAGYVEYLKGNRGAEEVSELLDILTTNHSFFYREREHFNFLAANVLAPLRQTVRSGKSAQLRIWSAGCAAGEEAYSIAMTVLEALGPEAGRTDWGVLATDISSVALQNGREGVYPSARLKDLPRGMISKYMLALEDGSWIVLPEVKKQVLFKRLNLMRETFPFKGAFDVVFCRNVMIYFDAESRSRLVNSLYRVIKPGGYLFVGHSESLSRNDCPFHYVKPAIYRKEE